MPHVKEPEPSPPELFETFFGPSLFTPWSRVLLDHAQPEEGERVLDLACATGIVARQVAPLVGEQGDVVGLDISPDMLAVARDRAASEGVEVDWREGDAMAPDLPDDQFDLILCQQGVQFFPDPVRALEEAARVLGPDGRIALNVWPPLERHPVYSAILEAEARRLDTDIAEVATPFMFGDAARLDGLLDQAGFQDIEVSEETLDIAFPDPDTFVALTVLAGAAVVPAFAQDDPDERADLIESIAQDTEDVLQEYRDGDQLRFPMPNTIAVASV